MLYIYAVNGQITGPFQIFHLSKFVENVVSAQLCSFLQKIISMKNFSQVSGLTIAQKLHLLKLQMICFLRQTKAASFT